MAAALVRPLLGGLGCIVTLHRVAPDEKCSPLPSNRALEITPEDLRSMLQWLEWRGTAVIALDEVPARLAEPQTGRFVSFTFDDGYRDNLTLAYPIFREFGVPFAVNVTSGFIAGTASVWWYFLEEALAFGRPLQFSWKDRDYRYAAATVGERNGALDELSGLIRGVGMQRDELLRAILRRRVR